MKSQDGGPGRAGNHGDDLNGDDVAVRTALSAYYTEVLLNIDPQGRILGGEGGVASALGYGEGEQFGSHIGEHIHPDDLANVLDVVEWARGTEPPFSQRIYVRGRHRDGHWIPFRAEVLSAEVPLRGVVVRIRALDGDDAEFVQSDERFASLADVVPVGILTSDARGFVVFSNEPASRVLGLDPDTLHGHGWIRCLSDKAQRDVNEAAQRVLTISGRERIVVEIERLGEQRWVHVTLVRLGSVKRPTGWLATLEDITERQLAAARLVRQATHDPLTGLPNRLLLEDRLEQAVARLMRTKGTLVVLFCDLDDFKVINDELGHAAGDAVLIEMARRLSEHLREADTLVRLGGDEFVAVCEGIDEPETELLVQRLRAAVQEPMPLGEGTYVQTISIGVVVADGYDSELSPATLLARADQAMYSDKRIRK